MAEVFLFDTSAFLTLTDREAGSEYVRQLLQAARRGELKLHACFVSLTEVQYILTYDRGAAKAGHILAALQRFPIQWLHSDAALCASAADIKAAHKLSFADSFVAAAALRLSAVLVHKDPEFDSLGGIINLKALPPKTGKLKQNG